jgi:hypothetical protein
MTYPNVAVFVDGEIQSLCFEPKRLLRIYTGEKEGG